MVKTRTLSIGIKGNAITPKQKTKTMNAKIADNKTVAIHDGKLMP